MNLTADEQGAVARWLVRYGQPARQGPPTIEDVMQRFHARMRDHKPVTQVFTPSPAPEPKVDGRAKITAAQALAIRLDKRPRPEIAAEYAISRKSVASIQLCQKWRSVGGCEDRPAG